MSTTINPFDIHVNASNLDEVIRTVLPYVFTVECIVFTSIDSNHCLSICSEEPGNISIALVTDEGTNTVWSTHMYSIEPVATLVYGFNAQYTISSIGFGM